MEIGKKQILYMDHKTGFGVYLRDSMEKAEKTAEILLPIKQVPADLSVDDPVEVFVYRDSSDRMIATTRIPMLTLGETAVLEVVQVNSVGAFMYWGLEKDLLLPYAQQTRKVKKGDRFLVGLYEDKSSRLCATMKVYDMLRTDSPYKKDDEVKGVVYASNPDFGVFVAVDCRYQAMIPKNELVRRFNMGEEITARVISVREDGKMNLSVRNKAHVQMDVDCEKIYEKLCQNEGFLPYHDKSAPDDIRAEFGMSKNEFKRAIGRLYRQKSIVIEADGIRKL
ncbi:MAG: S1 RNA-binding domain-containing protein [Eubacterium sp.]|nr:S1 RNA-binding domain-containing protein [Eubacterium sp.]